MLQASVRRAAGATVLVAGMVGLAAGLVRAPVTAFAAVPVTALGAAAQEAPIASATETCRAVAAAAAAAAAMVLVAAADTTVRAPVHRVTAGLGAWALAAVVEAEAAAVEAVAADAASQRRGERTSGGAHR
jgi:hypothetical protein